MRCPGCGQWVADHEARCAHCGAVAAPASGPAPAAMPAAWAPRAAPAGERPGGFWRRLWAGVLDGLVLFFPVAIARELLGVHLEDWNPAEPGPMMAALAFQLVLGWLYCALLESSRAQATLGQQVLDLRVTDLQGRRVSFLRATGRHWAQWISVMICGVGYLVNLWTRRRQTLHDLVSGCVVVRPEPALLMPAAGAGERP